MPDLMKLSDALTKDELRSLREKSDLKAFATLSWNWGLIAAAFAIAIVWTNPFTILVGINPNRSRAGRVRVRTKAL